MKNIDSKLTHILKEGLGGNSKTSIIATISQLKSNLEETISTLNFAYEIKKIKNNIKRNEELSVNNAKIMEEKFLNLQNNYKLIFSQYMKNYKKISESRKYYTRKRKAFKKYGKAKWGFEYNDGRYYGKRARIKKVQGRK